MRLGPYTFERPIVLAPMAGITDRPFRQLCRRHGADYAVSEMISASPLLRASTKSQKRLDHHGEPAPHIVQIAGADPVQLAQAARINVDEGADIIDINMGCPAKKVCKRAAGSALLKDEKNVARLLAATVSAVEVPVTLKIRTGWDMATRNGVRIARIAEQAGIAALAVHGRTRACLFKDTIEYDTIAAISAAVEIPVLANGDISSGEQAAFVLNYTGAEGLLIGRGAQGNPWIFAQIKYFLSYGAHLALPSRRAVLETALDHVAQLHDFYGVRMGVRIARKHFGWYMRQLAGGERLRQEFNRLADVDAQLQLIERHYQSDDLALAA